jgi:hypothetical protein
MAQMRTKGGFGAWLRKVWAVARKDLRAEFRAKEVFATMATFSVLAVVVFGLAFDLRVPDPEMVAPGVLWVVVLFGGVLGLNRTFGAEVDRGSLAALLLAPMDRSVIYCRLDKFSESLADATTAVDLATTGNADVLNHRAYMRALAKQELKEGLTDVERAIKLAREPVSAFLDTRGYLHHLLGNQQAALADLNQAIAITEAQRANPEDFFERRRRRDGRIIGWDARQIAQKVEQLGENLAVMYHHRGEVHEKLGQDEAAAADFKQADKFGYDPAKGIF